MAILVDISQIVIANIAMSKQAGKHAGRVNIDDNFIKHMIINSIRLYNVKFKGEYGEMIICCDSANTWRKQKFPEYKAGRKKHKDEESTIDWAMVYRTLADVIVDLKTYFPYKVLKVAECEADDIMGTLAKDLKEPVMVVSADGDMTQLLRYKDVKQFDPIHKKFIECENPATFLKEKIIRGDSGDGIPNILSDNDTFVNPDKRQKSIYETKLASWLYQEPSFFCESDAVLRNYYRNEELIDLSKTPQRIQDEINKSLEEPIYGNRQTVIEYFSKNRMRNLLEVVEQF